MVSTTFQGPVRTGKETGAPSTDTIGTLIAEQRATVATGTSGASSIVLPEANSSIQDIVLDVLVADNASAATMTVRVGTATDETRFASITASAAGRYRLGVAPNVAAGSAAAMETVAGPQRLYIDVTAAGSALGTFSGVLSVLYIQR